MQIFLSAQVGVEMRYGLLNDLRPLNKEAFLMVERYVALAYDKQKVQKRLIYHNLCYGRSYQLPKMILLPH